MKKLILAALAGVALATGSAMAADMAPVYKAPPAAPAWSWNGFYVGANLGGHWDNDNLTYNADPTVRGAPGATEINALSTGSVSPNGVIGGLQAGYNWQTSNVVWGLEADANWVGGTGSRSLVYTSAVTFNRADATTNATRVSFLATFRGRLGVTTGPALFYVTAGGAVGTIQTTDTFCYFGCPAGVAGDLAVVSASTTRVGWTAGGGIEYYITHGWSVKAEYLYVNLGNFNNTIPSCANCVAGLGIAVNHNITENIVRGGVNLHF